MIHAPCLMPDEDARGYWGRVLRLNAVSAVSTSELSFTKQARRQLAGESSIQNDVAAAISSVAGISVAELIQGHTLVPYHGAVAGTVNSDWCDDSYASWDLRNRGTSNRAYVRALCPKCADEDLRFWGFSYWRRSHQIDELVWCQKHECPIFRMIGARTWQALPHELKKNARPASDAVLADAAENPVLQRYAETCIELLHRQRPLASFQILRSLVPRASARGLVAEERAKGPRLSDLAVERIVGPWQKLFWKELSSKTAGAYLPALDDTLVQLRSGPRRHGYALAFALLYDSVDEALNDLQKKLPTYRSLIPLLNAEASRVGHHAAARRKECTENRPERLRAAIRLLLSGSPLDSAASSVGLGGNSVGRVLVQCLTTGGAHLIRETSRPARLSPQTAV